MWRRFIKRAYVFLLCLCLLCASAFTKEVEIPFTCEKDGRISILFSDDQFNYLFFLDTASTDNVLFNNGYSKLSEKLGTDIKESLIEYLTQNNPDKSKAEINAYAEEYIKTAGIQFNIGDLKYKDFAVPEVTFVYRPEENSKIDFEKYDGIINLDFFGDVKNILIDYKDKKIKINSDEKLKYSVSYEKFTQLNLYLVEVSLNGVKQQALIDTGASCLFLRDNYKDSSRITEEKLLNSLQQAKADSHAESKIKVKLQIGRWEEKITGIYPDINNYNLTDNAEKVLQNINLLGYDVFKNHKIQFDFNKKEFRIE